MPERIRRGERAPLKLRREWRERERRERELRERERRERRGERRGCAEVDQRDEGSGVG